MSAVLNHDSSDKSSTAFLLDLRSHNAIAKNTILLVDTIIGDLVVVSRAWYRYMRELFTYVSDVSRMARMGTQSLGHHSPYTVSGWASR